MRRDLVLERIKILLKEKQNFNISAYDLDTIEDPVECLSKLQEGYTINFEWQVRFVTTLCEPNDTGLVETVSSFKIRDLEVDEIYFSGCWEVSD